MLDSCVKKLKKTYRMLLRNQLFWILVVCFGVQFFYYSQMLPYEVCGDTSSYTFQYDPSFRTPIYPFFAAVVRFFTGDAEAPWLTTMANIQKIVMFASIPLFWSLVCMVTRNKYLRVLVTLLYGTTPAIFSWSICILTESFSIVEIVLLLYFTIKYLYKHSSLDAFLSGLVVLLMVLTRPAAIYLLAVYAVFWGAQLLIAIRRRSAKKYLFTIRFGVLGFVIAVLGVLCYCSVQKVMFGKFGLSSVSYVNDLLMVIDTDLYRQSSNEEVRDYIYQRKEETADNYVIIWQGLMKNYTRDELERFVQDLIDERRIDYLKKIVLKMVKWGSRPIATIYNSFKEESNFDLKQSAGFFYPISFGLVYYLVFGGIIWICIRVKKKKRLDWALFVFVMLIGGNVAVTIIAAPYEPERLCVTSLPILLVGITYVLEVSAKFCDGVRLESRIK